MILKLEEWLNNAILNQQEIVKECEKFEVPLWNRGYMEALKDIQTIINCHKEDRLLNALEKSKYSMEACKEKLEGYLANNTTSLNKERP